MGAESRYDRDQKFSSSKVSAFRYSPGETGPAGSISLSTNEAPWPPSQRVIRAIEETADNSHAYPDPLGEPLRSMIAEHHGLPSSCVMVSSGADGLLDGCFRAFVRPGDSVYISDPTYPVLNLLCAVYSAQPVIRAWPLKMTVSAVLTFVVNPNSPTGAWVEPDALRRFIADQPGIVVIDEAYAPFADGSVVGFVLDYPHQLVVRTFSKAYSLAGMRVGYALGAPDLISEIRSAHLPYPTSTCALAAATAALTDTVRHAEMVDLVKAERAKVRESLTVLGWDVPPSFGNFLYARPPGGQALRTYQELAKSGVMLRYFPNIDSERLRITIASKSANESFLSVVSELAVREQTGKGH
jgi:histidinol-phosphate aminotransferase